MRLGTVLVLSAVVLAAPHLAFSEAIEHPLVNGDPVVLDSWPGPDGLIGTGDDVVNANLSSVNFSAPNSMRSFSYNAFDFDGTNQGQTDPWLPDPMNAVTFLSGSVTVDTTPFAGSGTVNLPVITTFTVNGTEPFPGHGSYDATVTNVNSGTYDTNTHAFSINVDFVANLTTGSANGVNFDLSGEAYYIEAADFAVSTGNSYVDGVLLPAAQSAAVSSLFYIDASGTVPASTGGTGGSFPAMDVKAVLVGFHEGGTAVQDRSWSGVKALFRD
jgi:hypothetical protein